MAEEFRGEIAINALWPKTAIHTAAMEMLGGSDVSSQCRKPDIMADAAYAIFSKPKSFTGNFVIDEELLKEHGISDFDVYAVDPGHPLLPDFFLDEEPEELAKKMQDYGATPKFQSGKEQVSAVTEGPVAETFKAIEGALSVDVVKSTGGVYQFELSGDHPGTWYIDLKNESGSIGHGGFPGKADVRMSMNSEDFVKMFAGKMKPTMAFMTGKLKIKGDMSLAIKLEKLMTQLKAKL
ncbi:hypothetical protein scyTo_0009209 [Scyliorhinus torazame]|uniref:SCP2 domain-containing protein n=2 Tax=Scyliorhinus torazame TaxID=75743 RepID=A0A401NIE1_SCYTO|nr:hypothetical protein [Scyliorhinus torazame]